MARRSILAALSMIALSALCLPVSARADAGPLQNSFDQAVSRGPVWALMAAFAGGLLVSLTPCVYPMIAITVSVFGARKAKTRRDAALLCGAFVLGIAVMFTALGVGAAVSGSIFGSLLSNKLVVCFVALVLFALSASMFGVFELELPPSLTMRLSTVGGFGHAGAFALGLVSALVAAPCTGPVLGGILLWIAASHQVVLGTAVMFAFAIGLGVPFFLVGTFAISLPKSGAWMLGVKWLFGVVLAVVALYFLRTAVPAIERLFERRGGYLPFAALALIAAGVMLASVHVRAERRGSTARHLSSPFKWMSVPPAIVGGFVLAAWSQLPKAELRWVDSESEGRQLAETENRPMIIDFGAQWCAACNELKTRTFADAAVRSEASRFVAVSVDATDDENPQTASTKDRYHVVGLPTVVLLDRTGRERMRFAEFVPPQRFLDALRSID